VYSIFRGTLGGVDRQLAHDRRLVFIQTPGDIPTKLQLTKRTPALPVIGQRPALQQILAVARELMDDGPRSAGVHA
jgi:hypothetical protein